MKFNITQHRKLWLTISAALVGLSLALVGVFGFNLGLDFLGGLRWGVQFEQTVERDALIDFLNTHEDLTKSAQVQASGENSYLVTLEGLNDEGFEALSADVIETFGAGETTSFRRVDSSIGKHFQGKAFWAIGMALVAIIFFVAIAFRKIPKSVNPWRFGGAAIVALFHDVLIIVGIFAVLGSIADVELDLQFITALLATLGFSVNDTIVILDRVRENLRLQKSTENFEAVVEKSVQQTLRRSINTSISTLLPLVFLLAFGAESIFYFILALTIGILVGTYSSIFLAAPLLVTWKNFVDSRGE